MSPRETYAATFLYDCDGGAASAGRDAMNAQIEPALSTLLDRLTDWTPIPEFEASMASYFSGPRSTAEVQTYRSRSGSQKKLRDELTPVLHHFQFLKVEGEVRFALNDDVPDCWVRANASAVPHGMEVTIAQAREQHHLGKELNEKGVGRGFLGLPDSAPSAVFTARLARPRDMHSTEAALYAVREGIKSCIAKKAKSKYRGFDLLIEAPLGSLPRARWSLVQDELRAAARETPFHRVHVISNRSPEPFGFCVK